MAHDSHREPERSRFSWPGPRWSADREEFRKAGTDHHSVTDVALTSPFLVSIINGMVPKAGGGEPADQLYVMETMNDLVLKFFNAYLKREGIFNPATTY